MSTSEPDVIETGPECPQCGRPMRWIVVKSPGDAANTRRVLADCGFCLDTEGVGE